VTRYEELRTWVHKLGTAVHPTRSLRSWILASAVVGLRRPADQWLAEALTIVGAQVDAAARNEGRPFAVAARTLCTNLALEQQAAADMLTSALADVFAGTRENAS